MTSRRYGWQKRWQLGEGEARHDTGLVVRLVDGLAVAVNATEIIAALTPKHGAGNAPLMVARLEREAAQLLRGPPPRIGEKGGVTRSG